MGDDSELVEQRLSEGDRRVGERRRRKVYVFRDRRTGFDRRVSGSDGGEGVIEGTLIGLRDRPRLLLVLLGAVNVLNIADFVLTLAALAGGGEEANPVMRLLLALGPVWAGLFKAAAVVVASWIIWHLRRYRLALEAALLVAGVFLVVLVYQVVGLMFLT